MILQQYKIVFAGCMGAGKTQAINSLSEIPVLATEAFNTDYKAHDKTHTTVGIDYGEVSLDENTKIGLYGTPGQERFNFIWPVICQGALGIIILIDHHHSSPLNELEEYLSIFEKYTTNIAIGITHVDQENGFTTSSYREWLIQHKKHYPLFLIDARKQSHVLLMVESLIATLEVNSNVIH